MTFETGVEGRLALEAEVAELRARAVEANEVRLVDGDGRVRGLLAMDGDHPKLAFLDGDGRVRAKLVVSSDGPGLTFTDEAGRRGRGWGSRRMRLRIGFADANGEPGVLWGDALWRLFGCMTRNSVFGLRRGELVWGRWGSGGRGKRRGSQGSRSLGVGVYALELVIAGGWGNGGVGGKGGAGGFSDEKFDVV